MKKLFAFILVLILSANTAFAADISKVEYEEKSDLYSLIVSLGIIDEDSEPETVLTRGQFVKIVYNIKSYRNKDVVPSENASYFKDVDIYHYAAGYIAYLVSAGVVKGYETSDFRPEQNITAEEAARMLLRAGGYGAFEDYGFGSLSEYIAKVKKGISGDITCKKAAEMIYNLLFMDSMTLTFNNGNAGYESGDIILKDILKLDYTDGVIETAGGKNLYGKEAGENELAADGRVFETKTGIDAELLGMYARVFYSDNEAMAVLPLKNTVMTIDAEDINRYSDNRLYYDENDKDRTVKISSAKDILYNGYAVGGVSEYLPKNGSVKLIDRKSDGIYDCIMIESYESFIAKSAGINSEEIIVKTAGGEKTISLKDYDKTEITDESGNETAISSVNENNVLMIYSYKKEYIKIVIVSNSVSAAIKQIGTSSSGKTVIKTDVSEFECYDNYYFVSKPSVGETVTLCLDIYGRVAGIISEGSVGWRNGFLIFSRMADTDDGEKRILLKLVNEAGNVEKIYCDEKIYINGIRLETEQAFDAINNAYNGFSDKLIINGAESENVTTRLVRYFQSGDIIKRIDTPLIHSMFDESVLTDLSMNNKLLLQVKGYLYSPENTTGFRVVYGSDIPGEIAFGKDAIIFIVPEESNANPVDDDYGVMKASDFKYANGKFYYTSGYACTDKGLLTEVAVVRKNRGASSDVSTLMVNTLSKAVNEDDDVVYMIETADGTEYRVSEKDNDIEPSTIKKGDVILYELSNGELIIRKLLYRLDGGGELNKQKYYVTEGSEYHFNVPFRAMMGNVGKIDGSSMQISFNDSSRSDELVNLPQNIYICDTTNQKPWVYVGESKDISYNDTVIITSRKGKLQQVIIIKN